MANILIGCEQSGRVRDAFTKRGHSAVSCDFEQSDTDGEHYQGNIFDIINENWDLIIAFPPCTHLSAAGAPSWKIKQADGRQQEAIDFVLRIWNNKCPKIAIENPTGILSTVWQKPTQIINPFQFGEPFRKRTCLWLKNLPVLTPTKIVEPEFHYTSNSYHGGKLKDGTRRKSKLPIFKAWDSAKERSKTFFGIAEAMAEQWHGCTCLVDECGCESPDTNPALISDECPIHNFNPYPNWECPIHGEQMNLF